MYINGNTTSGFSSFSFLLLFGARYLLLVGGSGRGPGWGTATQFILELITVNGCCAFQVVDKPASYSNCLAPWVQRGGWVVGLRLCYLQIRRENAVIVWKLLFGTMSVAPEVPDTPALLAAARPRCQTEQQHMYFLVAALFTWFLHDLFDCFSHNASGAGLGSRLW